MDLREQLRATLQGRVAMVGLGNVDYADDGFGVRLAEVLQADGWGEVFVAGTGPERLLLRLNDELYDHVLLLDAVEFGAAPGAVVFLNAAGIQQRFPQVSTHKLALGSMATLLESVGKTKAWLLGAQPQTLKPGGGLTETLQVTLQVLRAVLSEVLGEQESLAQRLGLKAARRPRHAHTCPSAKYGDLLPAQIRS